MERRLARWLRSAGIAAMVIAGAVGCGSSDDGDNAPTAPNKPAEASVPTELLGTYRTTLKRSDLPPNPPRELTGGSMKWTLTIAKLGGVDNGPVFAIAGSDGRTLEGPSFSVTGDRILLHREECAAGGLYENAYKYKLSDKTLVLTKVKNLCPDQVALTILTSEPWTKTQ
jgi:hypothetical protein